MTDSPLPLVGEQQTMLMTLRMHEQDARSPRPILGDRYAADVLTRVTRSAVPDDGQHGAIDGNRPVVCTRARLIDEATRSFLRRHPDAVVLHLGCGLDSRVLRVDPGPAVTWFEVDQAPVMALRRTAYDERRGVVDVAASVTDDGWWARVPAGRPVLAIAEGLLMYLPPTAVRLVVDHLLDLEASDTDLIADTVAPWVRRIAGWHPAFRAAGTGFESATADFLSAVTTASAERTVARPGGLHRREASLPRATQRHTTGSTRAFLRAFCVVPALERSMVLHQVGTQRATLGP